MNTQQVSNTSAKNSQAETAFVFSECPYVIRQPMTHEGMPIAMKGRKSRAEIFKVTGIKNFYSQWWVGLESGEDV